MATSSGVMLVPGGGSSVRDYFSNLERALAPHAQVITVDPPGLEAATGRRWLTLADHAGWLGEAIHREQSGPVVVVGHSLGGLVGLRLALDQPDLVAALLLLDPSPPILAALLPWPLLRLIGLGRKLRLPARPRPPRAVPLRVRVRWFVVLGGTALAADIIAGGITAVPTVLVLAGEHQPGTQVYRAYARLVDWIPTARLEVWPDTRHDLHLQEPDKVAEATLALLRQ